MSKRPVCPPTEDPPEGPPESAAAAPEDSNASPDAGGWVRVMASADLPDGGVRAVKAGARELCLMRHEGRCAAVDDFCPHQGAPLSTGWIYEGQIVCAWHGWAFDVVTGEMGHGGGPAVRVHEVQERDDGIYVRLRVWPRRE